MRIVLRNLKEVCHVWASRSQYEGNCGNMSFRDDVIYSYRAEIAKFISDDVVLISNESWSSTTSSHQSSMSMAIPDTYKRLYVTSLEPNHKENITDYIDRLKDTVMRFSNARDRKQCIFDSNQNILRQLRDYIEHFEFDMPMILGLDLDYPFAHKAIKAEEVKYQAKIAEQAKRQREFNTKYAGEIKKLENGWINNLTNETQIHKHENGYDFSARFSETRLRYLPDKGEIQTSHSAYVSAKAGKILFDRIQAGEQIRGHKINGYTVISFNGTLKIGCHEITRNEINRLAKVMNW